MRTKNAKRIGPVPIVVVAVFALAAFLSAGLLALGPGSTQAQTATATLDDVTLDVGDSHTFTSIMVRSVTADPANDVEGSVGAFPADATTFTIESDQDDGLDEQDPPQRIVLTDDADTNGTIETADNNLISIDPSDGEITIATAVASQVHAMQADNTARITVRANDATGDALAPIRFDLTIVQNPFEENGTAVTNPADWNAASSSACAVVTTNGTTVASRGITLTSTTVLVDGGDCTSSGNSIDVNLQNNQTDGTKYTYLVYVSGGDSFSKVDGFSGKSGLNQELHEVDDQDALGDPGEATISVSRSMADSKGQVYLYGYLGTLNEKRIKTSSEAFTAEESDFVVRVQFVDGPALAFDSKVDDKDFDADDGVEDVDGSTLLANTEPMGYTDANMDGYHDGMFMIENNDEAIKITATIKDAKGNPLNAGDKDSRVDFSVMYVDGSDIVDSTTNFNSRKVIKKGMNYTTLDVSGWNSGNKAVRVMVSATYTSPSAPDGFDLGMVTLTRVADAASTANFMTYSCSAKKDAPAAKGCMAGYAAMEDMRFGREQYFVVNGQFEDVLGSKTEDRPEVKVTGDAVDAIDKSVTVATGYMARATAGSVLLQVKEEAPYGEYTIMVTNGEAGDDEVMRELTITVAGPPMTYEFSDPAMYIPAMLGSSQKFTLMVMDENGNVPDFTDAKDAEIVVLGVESSYVTGLNGNNADFDMETGQATFTIFAPVGATQGQTVLIQVRVDGAVVASHTVMFGEEGAAPGPTDPMERDGFTADYTVDATSTAGSGMVDVSWTRSEELSLSLVSLIQGDDVVDFTITLGTSTQFSGVDTGEYDVSVFSFRITEDGEKDGEIAFGTVTVE